MPKSFAGARSMIFYLLVPFILLKYLKLSKKERKRKKKMYFFIMSPTYIKLLKYYNSSFDLMQDTYFSSSVTIVSLQWVWQASLMDIQLIHQRPTEISQKLC